ncbi:MAG TPA: beta-ketoacyl-ACP synthase II [Candidatus Limnocylindrales bacterium]|nr:beta-ketoacyl-ACP synthase II [Candidatus Limnocylindrales bacterium]
MRRPDYDRRVVITGLGLISPVGNDRATAWDNLVNGRSGIREITRFDTTPYTGKAGGEVEGFVPSDWLDPKTVRRTGRELQMGVASAKLALADSGLEVTDENRTEIGVIYGSGSGGQEMMNEQLLVLRDRGPDRVSPTFIAHSLVDSTSGMIAIETGAIGHNMCVVTACSTGTSCVGEAAEAIRRGDCIAVIAGSTENALLEIGHAGFSNMRGVGTPRPGFPITDVSRPYDRTRNGFILGEGAAALILEDLEVAKARGARIYAEVVGYGSAADGWDMIQPIEGGVGVTRAIRMALDRRGVPADEIDVINPHGTSTPVGDKREADAFWSVFGDRTRSIAISATKSMTGHMMGAAGAFEAFATAMSVAEQTVPGTLNYLEPDPECDLFVLSETREMPVRSAVSCNVGLGGHNAAVIFRRYDGD